MKFSIIPLIVLLLNILCASNASAQGKITRPTNQQSQTSNHKTSRNVTISEPDGYINGHGYVDLGLPSGTKWATCNVGASSPDKSGEYFSWGEIETKTEYSDNACTTVNKEISDFSGNPYYDVASTKWGNNWCIPTVDETEELAKLCKWTWIKYNLSTGYKITGPNGKSIFLPAKGWKDGAKIMFSGSHGIIWTSSPSDVTYGSYALNFYKGQDDNIENRHYLYRRKGANVRPIIR